ncbi:esterase-like activity of phytase family protein [Rhodococcus daqingensis]|uniref:Esterase-like activity of phytase family protein n=1 Tax=Rhodococcus daqingensis TaxID=2479363 RepID=A0ABW2RWF4_9NOCA
MRSARSRVRLVGTAAVSAALVLCAAPTATAVPDFGSSGSSGSSNGHLRLGYVNSITVPTGTPFDGFPIGGLSGIDYDSARGEYVAISDNRGEQGPVRYYSLRLPLDQAGKLTTAEFTGQTSLLDTNQAPFTPRTADTESIRYLPGSDSLLYTSEGSARIGLPGFVRETARDGKFLRDYALPEAYTPKATPPSGFRDNLGFEAVTVDRAGTTITAASENALAQDGPAISDQVGSQSRFLRIDRVTGAHRGEFVYDVDPVRLAPGEPFVPVSSVNGIGEILAVGDSDYLVLERNVSAGGGFSVKIFRTDVHGAENVAGKPVLGGTERKMRKELVFDFAAAGVNPECIEGITWGPTGPDGTRTLVLVADDNFGLAGKTTFHLLTVGR